MIRIRCGIGLLTENRLIHMINCGEIIGPYGTIISIGLDIHFRRICPGKGDGIGGVKIISAYPDFRYPFGIPILNLIGENSTIRIESTQIVSRTLTLKIFCEETVVGESIYPRHR